jgi:phosphatidylserine decarboxylase
MTTKKTKIGLITQLWDFKVEIYNDLVLRMNFEGALEAIPSGGVLSCQEPDGVFHILNSICINAPKFYDSYLNGLPFYALFIDLLDTQPGQTFFSHSRVNLYLKKMFNAYQIMLKFEESLKYMNEEEPHGWLSRAAQKKMSVNWDDYLVDKSKPRWGFTSWNDWFTRPIRPEARPIAPGKNVVVHSSGSTSLPGQQAPTRPCASRQRTNSGSRTTSTPSWTCWERRKWDFKH